MKTWFITGSSSGFGKQLATQLAQLEEVKLIATARKLSDLAYLDRYDHGQIKKLALDVTEPEQIAAAVAASLAFSDQIDVLVNNAGLGYFATIEESDPARVRQMFEVNFFGLAAVTTAFLPQLRKQGQGVIVNLSSALALTTLPTMGFYSASKYAVEGYSAALRQEVGPLGIRVLTVEPSGARTQWAGSAPGKLVPQIAHYAAFKETAATAGNFVTQSPGNPAKIARAIIEVVTSGDFPDHLPLGQFAYEGGLANLTTLVGEIKGQRERALAVDD